MITKQKLEIFSAIYTQYQVADFSLDILQGLSLLDLLALSTYETDKQLAFRKALLDKSNYQMLIKNLTDLNNWSCARSYSKVLIYITSPKVNHIRLSDEEYDCIIDVSFKWLTDPSCPVAVAANCMDILDQMSKKYAWVKEELYAQVEYLLRINPTPAIKSRSLKILKKYIK